MGNVDRMPGKSIIKSNIYHMTISHLFVALVFIWFTASAAWAAAPIKAPSNPVHASSL